MDNYATQIIAHTYHNYNLPIVFGSFKLGAALGTYTGFRDICTKLDHRPLSLSSVALLGVVPICWAVWSDRLNEDYLKKYEKEYPQVVPYALPLSGIFITGVTAFGSGALFTRNTINVITRNAIINLVKTIK